MTFLSLCRACQETPEIPLKALCSKCGKARTLNYFFWLLRACQETLEIPLKALCSKCGKARTLIDFFCRCVGPARGPRRSRATRRTRTPADLHWTQRDERHQGGEGAARRPGVRRHSRGPGGGGTQGGSGQNGPQH
jgi:hypothetical protein